MIAIDSTISAKAISEKISEKASGKKSVTDRTIENDLAHLKKLGVLLRKGGRKDGEWIIIGEKMIIIESKRKKPEGNYEDQNADFVGLKRSLQRMNFSQNFLLSLVPRFTFGESSGARKSIEKLNLSILFSRLYHDLKQPLFSFAVGQMVGSLLGGFAFTVKENVMISLCVKKGYTVFGLVDQDYTLPDDVREKLGFSVYGKEDYEFQGYQFQSYQKQSYQRQAYNWQTIDCIILKRGVIGFRKVGYV